MQLELDLYTKLCFLKGAWPQMGKCDSYIFGLISCMILERKMLSSVAKASCEQLGDLLNSPSHPHGISLFSHIFYKWTYNFTWIQPPHGHNIVVYYY